MVRKPKYLESEHSGRERWLISYTDIITLLLILFVAIAAQTVGQQQVRAADTKPQPVASPAAPAPTIIPTLAPTLAPPPAPSPSREALLRAQEKLQQHGLDPHLEARGLVISLPQAILFESGEDRINRSAAPIISGIADVLRDLDNKVELAGHADTVPIHNKHFKNNWELSAARSLSLLSMLTGQYGIAESRLTISSYGSNSPKGPNDTVDGRAENRRVEILILDEPQR
jgi:chemotaxis protein MotB